MTPLRMGAAVSGREVLLRSGLGLMQGDPHVEVVATLGPSEETLGVVARANARTGPERRRCDS